MIGTLSGKGMQAKLWVVAFVGLLLFSPIFSSYASVDCERYLTESNIYTIIPTVHAECKCYKNKIYVTEDRTTSQPGCCGVQPEGAYNCFTTSVHMTAKACLETVDGVMNVRDAGGNVVHGAADHPIEGFYWLCTCVVDGYPVAGICQYNPYGPQSFMGRI